MRRSEHPMEDPNNEPERIVEAKDDSGVPMSEWEVWPVMDSVEYMDRPVPIYRMEDGTLRQGAKIIKEDESNEA